MSFVKKIWKDRISQFPNRRTINDGHTVKRVTVGRDEGVVTEEGTPFDATEMNDLENRIFAAIEQGGGGGGSSGTYDYSELFNKPRVNNVELNGNKTTADLHINYDDLENKPDIPENATELPISANDSTNTKNYIDTGLSGKQDKSTLLSDIVKKYSLTGTTNSSGDITFDYKALGNCIIVSATKVRNSGNSNIGFSSIGRNAANDRYIIHLQDASGSPLASQNVEVIVHYIEIY